VTPQEGDLLFSYETRLGDAALMPADVEACLGRRMALLRPNRDRVDPRFLLYFYINPAFKEVIDHHTIHGATVNRIGLSTMGSWQVELPALPDQQAIGEVLGSLDDKIALNRRLSRTCRELAKAKFSSLTRSAADTISVGELIESKALVMSDGYRTKRSELDASGYRIIRVADIEDDSVRSDGTDFVSYKHSAAIGSKAGRPGDILLSTKGTVGRVATLPPTADPVVYSPQLCFFRIHSEHRVTRNFLQLWLSSAEFKEQASHRMNNTDMAPYINLVDIRSLRMTLPRIEDQVSIDGILDLLEQESQASRLENQMLASTRDALLPELMSGKLRVKDAEKTVEEVL
jgi:type I restriction enzyme S subunit